MKSPLVDALRQASNHSSEDAAQKKASESETQRGTPGADTANPQSVELDLLATGHYEVAGKPATEDVSLSQTDIELREIRSESGTAGADAGPLVSTAFPNADRSSVRDRKTAVAIIGQLSPVLCVIALSATAGAYLLLNQLTAVNLNEDFSEISDGVQTSAGQEDGGISSISLPVTGISIFEKIDQRPTENPQPADAGTQGPDNNTASDPVRYPIAEKPRSGQSAPDISSNSSGAVNDRAYASVLAAFEAYRAREFDSAEMHYAEALEIEPNHRDALAGMAAVYLQTDRQEQAVAAYERLLAIDPGNTVAAAAILAIRSDDVNWEFESELRLLLQRFPDSHHLHNALGSVYVGQERWPDAKYEFLSAHRLAPENADYSYNIAVSMERMGQQSAAQDYYKIALDTATEQSSIDRTAILAHLDELATQLRERL